MAGKLAAFVHVGDRVFAPGETPPKAYADRITNPRAWEGSGDDTSSGPPPRAGKGSGTDAWAEYAAANGVDVPDDAGRDDIIVALDAAGVPTE